MAARHVFVSAKRSTRAYLAASLLADAAGDRFDAWAIPSQEEQGLLLVKRVLAEQHVALLCSYHWMRLTKPFGTHNTACRLEVSIFKAEP